MKILIVTPYLPHPLSGNGASVYLYRLLERLIVRHEVTLVSFCDARELGLSGDLKKLPMTGYFVPRAKTRGEGMLGNVRLAAIRLFQLYSNFLRWEPYYVSKYRHPAMFRLLGRLTRENSYDIVRFEFAYMGQYVGAVRSGRTILHEIDVTVRPAYRRYRKAGSLIRKAAAFVEFCRWARYEPRIARRFDRVICLTEQDRMLLERLTKAGNTEYLPLAFETPERVPDYGTRKPGSLVFVGSYSHRPNVDAARWLCTEVFPAVLRRFPAAQLSIIGSHAPDEFLAFPKRYPGITILGFVDDVDPYLRTSAVFVAPLRFGGGVKTKILSAMAQGIPVVTTKVGIEGIEGIGPDAALVGESSERLAEQVLSLLGDPLAADRIGRRGHELVRTHYSWETVVRGLELIMEKMVKESRPR